MATNEALPHERINFNLRPSKRIERKLIAEALACIYRYDTPRRFGYVGMGSYYFSDFTLFHRIFGINKMVSIESDEAHAARFEFNKPFDCIDMRWGKTHDVLPVLDIFKERPVICWLDYYDRLSEAILGDASTFVRRAQPGSALLITLNARSLGGKGDTPQDFLKGLPEAMQKPNDRQRLYQPKGLAAFMTEMLTESIDSIVVDVNGGRDENDKVTMRQIVNLYYKDASPMITVGWLKLTKAQAMSLDLNPSALDSPGVSLLGHDIVEVIAPVLTFKEVAHLKSLLPNGRNVADFEEKSKHLPIDEAKRFSQLYRYYPSFADIEE